MFTINIGSQQFNLDTSALTEEDKEDLQVIGSKFGNKEEAIAGLLAYFPNIEELLTEKKRTPAVYVKVTNTIGWWVSKEFLLGTGTNADADLVKENTYTVSYTEFISKCSKTVRDECQKVLAKKLGETETTTNTTKLETWKPSTWNKSAAVAFMVKELQGDNEGNLSEFLGEEKWGAWLAGFVGAEIRKDTAKAIQCVKKGDRVFFSVDRKTYARDRARWQKAFEVIKNSCRGSKLEYMPTVNGEIPFKIRGTSAGKNI